MFVVGRMKGVGWRRGGTNMQSLTPTQAKRANTTPLIPSNQVTAETSSASKHFSSIAYSADGSCVIAGAWAYTCIYISFIVPPPHTLFWGGLLLLLAWFLFAPVAIHPPPNPF